LTKKESATCFYLFSYVVRVENYIPDFGRKTRKNDTVCRHMLSCLYNIKIGLQKIRFANFDWVQLT